MAGSFFATKKSTNLKMKHCALPRCKHPEFGEKNMSFLRVLNTSYQSWIPFCLFSIGYHTDNFTKQFIIKTSLIFLFLFTTFFLFFIFIAKELGI